MTPEQLRPLLLRLIMAFGQPFGFNSAGPEELARTWLNVLGDCELRDVSAAIDQWVRTQKKWPTPAGIREDAWAIFRVRKPKHLDTALWFCPRCFARDLIELANGRFMPLHAEDCPNLHPQDQLDQRHALETGRAIWRNGAPPKLLLTAALEPVRELTLTT